MLFLYFLHGLTPIFCQQPYRIATIAFYNVENLFDCENDPLTFDDDRTPEGKDHWTKEHYDQKIKNTAKVIAAIGADKSKNAPIFLGVAEIENKTVLDDLMTSTTLAPYGYKSIHFDSPDRRGIDVALLYQNAFFIPTHYSKHELVLYDREEPNKRIFSRDQLLVSGLLDGDLIHCIVNHWPSRRGGEKRSAYKRLTAARLNKKIIDSLQAIDPYAKIITMGDFNDDPTSASIKKTLNTKATIPQLTRKTLFNPMEKMMQKGYGSLAYRDQWNLFDQIIISKGILENKNSGYTYYKAGIFSENFIVTPTGKYQGYPYRSFANGTFTGGYSDHFPVYLFLIKKQASNN